MTYPNPLRARERTLNDLLTELKARLGFVTQGVASKLIDPLLTSFLQEGQEYVFEQLGAQYSKKRATIKLAEGSKLYDCHNDEEDEDIDPHAIDEIVVYDTPTSFTRLQQGITEWMRCDDTTPTIPERFDFLNGQIELYPTPDDEYDLVILYQQGVARFTQPGDRCTVPSRLVLLYAIASAKAHYQHQDAQTAGNIFQSALRLERQKQHDQKRYFCLPRDERDRRQVRRTPDGGYVL